MMAEHKVKGLAFGSVYVDDFPKAYAFYADVLGLEKEYDMGDAACFFKLSDNTGLYLQGKNKPASYAEDTMRAGFVFAVESASATYDRLKAAGARFIHTEPRHMGGELYWFQFFDPCGNILEALGGK
jgi:predicted enzyme related to lactoylglutathione lyase